MKQRDAIKMTHDEAVDFLHEGMREMWPMFLSTNGPGGVGAKGIDNMFWTSFRYYLP